ncbi:MAG: hypothetical protein HZA61_15755 [Candidatus Eisenbacteria bacterium]|uniref:Uncharacterized protein n=1 Tax=Eiseniibacteriota bacterium TaxID=2212470 RepID=A0A933SGM1_UNCEI|nr:hypothetical protein [Candidatus Eisenbacteria bacterium]
MPVRPNPMRAFLTVGAAAVLLAAAAAGTSHADGTRPDTTHRAVRPMVEVMTEADSAVRARGGARADAARLLLSWRAPWGAKRATQELRPSLADTTAEDTLYLCFRPGRTSPTFNGFTATLEFHCAPGDTLGPFWHFEKTGANAGGLAVQFGPEPRFPGPQPWTGPGMGRPAWEHTSEGGKLRLVFAVPYTQPGAVDSSGVYALGRVLIRHKRAALAGARQPICIEWKEASLAFALKDEPIVRQGERFVTWNAAPGEGCGRWNAVRKPESWKPPQARRKAR